MKLSKSIKIKYFVFVVVYISVVISFFAVDSQVQASGINDLIGNGNTQSGNQTTNQTENQTASEMFKMYEGKVIVLSRKNNTRNIVSPDSVDGRMYPDFEIYMFANQPSYYLIKLDNQTYKTGYFKWWARVKAHTEYQSIDIEVVLKNKTGVELPHFTYKHVAITHGGAAQPPSIVEPYVKMFTEGQVNAMLIKRVISDMLLAIWGLLTGIGMAVIRADLRGIERVF